MCLRTSFCHHFFYLQFFFRIFMAAMFLCDVSCKLPQRTFQIFRDGLLRIARRTSEVVAGFSVSFFVRSTLCSVILLPFSTKLCSTTVLHTTLPPFPCLPVKTPHCMRLQHIVKPARNLCSMSILAVLISRCVSGENQLC